MAPANAPPAGIRPVESHNLHLLLPLHRRPARVLDELVELLAEGVSSLRAACLLVVSDAAKEHHVGVISDAGCNGNTTLVRPCSFRIYVRAIEKAAGRVFSRCSLQTGSRLFLRYECVAADRNPLITSEVNKRGYMESRPHLPQYSLPLTQPPPSRALTA